MTLLAKFLRFFSHDLGLTLPKQPSTAKYNLPTSESTCEGEVCEISSLTLQATPELEVVKTLNEMEVC